MANLESGIKRLGIELTDKQINSLRVYIKELKLFNPSYKLVSLRDGASIEDHILDSLSGYKEIKAHLKNDTSTIADLGSGAGLPGIPLSIVIPEANFTLIERMKRRVGFLNNEILLCGIADHTIIEEKEVKNVNEKFDIIIFRAFRKLIDSIEEIDKLLNNDGIIIAYKGMLETTQTEVNELEKKYKNKYKYEIKNYDSFYTDSERCLLLISRA